MATVSLLCALFAVFGRFLAAEAKYYLSDHTATWYDANEQCRRVNLRLAVVDECWKADEIRKLIEQPSNCNPKTASYWTSGTDLANESTFVWFSTGKPVASGFTDWHSGQPSDCTSTENCIDIYVNGGELSWYDSDCNQAYYFICEDTCCPPPSC